MANHLTPTELAREAGLDRRDVIMKCLEMGVPIYHGRIDRTLFAASLDEQYGVTASPTPWRPDRSPPGPGPAPHLATRPEPARAMRGPA